MTLLFDPGASRLVMAGGAEARLWNPQTNELVTLKQPETATARTIITDAAFSPDGKRLATIHNSLERAETGARDAISKVLFWNPETGQQIDGEIKPNADRSGRQRSFSALAYSPNQKYLVTISSIPSPYSALQNKLELWKADDFKFVDEAIDLPRITQLSFNESGDDLALLTETGAVIKLSITNQIVRDRYGEVMDRGIRLAKQPTIYFGKRLDAIAFGKGDNQLIAVGNDGEVMVSGSQSGAALVSLQLKARAMSFTEDGRLLVADDRGRIQAWEAKTGELSEVRYSGAASAMPSPVTVLGDAGTFAATIGETIRVWDLARRQPVKQLKDPIKHAALSPEADYLALVDEKGVGWGMTKNNFALPLKLTSDRAETSVVAVSALIPFSVQAGLSYRQVAAAERDGVVRITELMYDEDRPEACNTTATIRHGGKISAMIFAEATEPALRFLVTVGDDAVKVWNPDTGASAGTPLQYASRVNDLAFNPKTNQLAVACQDGKIVVWAISSNGAWARKHILEFNDPVEKVAFGANGESLAAASGGKARIWNARTWETIGQEIKVGAGKTAGISLLGVSGDMHLLVAGADRMLRVWKADTGQKEGEPFPYAAESDLAYLSPTAPVIVTGSSSFPSIWELDEKKRVEGWQSYVSLSPDGKYLVSPYRRGIVVRAVDNPRRTTFTQRDVRDWTFTPDGALAIVITNPGPIPNNDESTIRLLNPATGEQIGQDVAHLRAGIKAAAFKKGGGLATLNVDSARKQNISFWENGKQDKQTISLDYIFDKLSFSPDEALLMATGEEAGTQIWDVATRRKVAEIPGAIFQSSISRDGKFLALDFGDRIEVSPRRPEDLAEDLCGRLKRNLTYNEWRQYLRDPEKRQHYELTCPSLKAHPTAIEEAIRLAAEGEKEEAEAVFKSLLDPKESAAAEVEWHKISTLKLREINEKMTWTNPSSNSRKRYIDENEAAVKKQLKDAIEAFNVFSANYKRHHVFAANPTVDVSASNLLNSLCWYGSLMGSAKDVKEACQIAVELDQKNAGIMDSRGVNRALIGEYKVAMEDLEAYARSSNDPEHRKQRRAWIDALDQCRKAGQDPKSCQQFPLTPEELKKIRGQ